ncbi:MAG TPA: lipid-binding SYLF domain-containing protein [Pyrinomonadaceae bacterium]|jgi:lipid-binding SYLF domain-containing protein
MANQLVRSVGIGLSAITILLPVLPSAATQQPTAKFKHAVVRSNDSAKIIELLNELPEQGFPKDLAARAQAVAVFPLVTKQTVLFQQSMEGYGVVSAREGNGWSMPAFYKFAGSGYTGKFAGESKMAVILLFMNKETVNWFSTGRVHLKDQKKAIAGPVGTMTEEQKKELASVNIFGYVYSESKLIGTNFGTTFKQFLLNPDNNINMPMYGMKGRLVLAGNQVDASKLPDGIPAFREALQRYYP